MEEIITASHSDKPTYLRLLDQFNVDNASAFTFAERYGTDTKKRFVDRLLAILEVNKSLEVQKAGESELVAVLTALRICLREPSGINTLFENFESLGVVLAYAGLSDVKSTTSWSVRVEAGKCLVNLVAKSKPIETLLNEKYNTSANIITLLNEEIPHANLFPLLRVFLHLSLNSSVAQSVRNSGLLALLKVLQRCFPAYTQEDVSLDTLDVDAIPLEALKVIFNLTLALGPLASGKPLSPSSEDIAVFHQLQPIYVYILGLPLPATYSTFLPIHAHILQLKLSVVNCLLNTPKGQFQSAFGVTPTDTQNSYMQPLNVPTTARTLKALLDILLYQTKSTEPASEALVPILMLLTTIAQEVPEVRDILKSFVFPKEVIDQLPESVGVETPAAVNQSSPVAGTLIPFMSSLEPALKHYVNEFFFIICDEDANEVCRLTGFGNAAGLLVMRGLMNVPGS